MYFNIKCIGKLPGPTNEFERSLVFETGEFERPKFDCMYSFHYTRAELRNGSQANAFSYYLLLISYLILMENWERCHKICRLLQS